MSNKHHQNRQFNLKQTEILFAVRFYCVCPVQLFCATAVINQCHGNNKTAIHPSIKLSLEKNPTYLKGQFTQNQNLNNFLLTTLSMEALATFSAPQNHCGVTWRKKKKNPPSGKTTKAYGGHVLKCKTQTKKTKTCPHAAHEVLSKYPEDSAAQVESKRQREHNVSSQIICSLLARSCTHVSSCQLKPT